MGSTIEEGPRGRALSTRTWIPGVCGWWWLRLTLSRGTPKVEISQIAICLFRSLRAPGWCSVMLGGARKGVSRIQHIFFLKRRCEGGAQTMLRGQRDPHAEICQAKSPYGKFPQNQSAIEPERTLRDNPAPIPGTNPRTSKPEVLRRGGGPTQAPEPQGPPQVNTTPNPTRPNPHERGGARTDRTRLSLVFAPYHFNSIIR